MPHQQQISHSLWGQFERRFAQQLQKRVSCNLKGHFESLSLSTEQHRALTYSFQSGGKSLRALLAYFCAQSLQLHSTLADSVAVAVEMAHTYTLIHDDLPAMDDDSFRRHRPSHHKVFPEAASILTGDALQAEAFKVLSKCRKLTSCQKLYSIEKLSEALGSDCLIKGQWNDLFAQPNNLNQAQAIHLRKTGDLFSFVLQAVGFIKCSKKDEKTFFEIGQLLGLCFQIQDDLLDFKADFKALGKLESSDSRDDKIDKGVMAFLTYDKACDLLKEKKSGLYALLKKSKLENTLLEKLIFGKILTV